MAQQVSGQPRYKRILLKLSGEALMGSEDFGIDPRCWIVWRWRSGNWSVSASRSVW